MSRWLIGECEREKPFSLKCLISWCFKNIQTNSTWEKSEVLRDIQLGPQKKVMYILKPAYITTNKKDSK